MKIQGRAQACNKGHLHPDLMKDKPLCKLPRTLLEHGHGLEHGH